MHRIQVFAVSILISAAACGGSSGASSADDFVALLSDPDCQSVNDNKGFDLIAMGRRFPVPRGFAYYGDNLPVPSFSANTLLKNAGAEQSGAAKRNDQEPFTATIDYIRDAELVAEVERDLYSFVQLEWSGQSVFFRSRVLGSVRKVPVYKAVVFGQDGRSVLLMTSSNAEIIARIVGCSKRI